MKNLIVTVIAVTTITLIRYKEPLNIIAIENVNEMEATPKEVYIVTPKGRYLFNGINTTLVEKY